MKTISKGAGDVSEKVDGRSRNHERGRSKEKILTIIQRVCELRRVEAALLFSPKRERAEVASARSLAMAACGASGVPLCHVARTFLRRWETVYAAEQVCAERYRRSRKFREEWDALVLPLDEEF